jgi:hypothetical protein
MPVNILPNKSLVNAQATASIPLPVVSNFTFGGEKYDLNTNDIYQVFHNPYYDFSSLVYGKGFQPYSHLNLAVTRK